MNMERGYTQSGRLHRVIWGVRDELPRMGLPGSRSALLHQDFPDASGSAEGAALGDVHRRTIAQLRTLFSLRWLGTIGALLIALGGLGAGALPVVGNPYESLPFGSLMTRMLQSASALVFIGVGFMVTAWVCMAPLVGAPLRLGKNSASASTGSTPSADPRFSHSPRVVTQSQMWRTWLGWVLPLLVTAPLFTQDIYSYLANGSIVLQGLDPYSAGPVELLGADNDLARSVPFIWANSPSPYGPVALGVAAVVSWLTNDSIIWGVVLHRVLSLVGIIAAGWAIARLATRCRVSPEAALWLGILNPLTILHLVGGIHNESFMLGLALVGVELGLRAVNAVHGARWRTWSLFIASGVLISCAGMVKVTGFIGLGFVGMAAARGLVDKLGIPPVRAVLGAGVTQLLVLAASIAAVTVITGIDIGWIFGQGGAATIRSWLSATTSVGVGAGFLGMLLGLGDHTEAILTVTRTVGVIIAAGFMIRMLFATYRGAIHPVGGLGVSTFVLVVFFPVVQPWYILWAVLPLAAWANRRFFRMAVIIYSGFMSFIVLPRGLGLPPGTVFVIYLAALVTFLVLAGVGWVALRRAGVRVLN